MDLKKMADVLDVSEADFLELAALFVTTCSSDLAKIETGLAAGDAEKVAFAAHSIKGAAGNLGFAGLAAIARTMETSARAGSLDGFNEKTAEIEQQIDSIQTAIG
ncbi:MAG: Hpt domain-containing protein [Desulfobacteraceae bacterium]